MTSHPMRGGKIDRDSMSSPFRTQLFPPQEQEYRHSPSEENDRLLSFLPASYRTKADDLVSADDHRFDCIKKEFDLQRIADVYNYLWHVGQPYPPRPLHHQLLVGREVIITEQIDLHLVWTAGRMFPKPIPRYLLDPDFWGLFLLYDEACHSLITYKSDFRIAKEKHLFPDPCESLTWHNWRQFVKELDTEHIYPHIDRRFYYGELRLSRLNKIYNFWKTPLRLYKSRWNQYDSFFQDNLSWLAATTLYIVVVLTAMQVGLATKTLEDNAAFQSASYGFTAFSILGPLMGMFFIFVGFCYIFISSFVISRQRHERRMNAILGQHI